jgi:hypothetical protein
MQLLDGDEAYLKEKGWDHQLHADGEGGGLIIKGFRLATGKYDHDVVDLLICIPKGYNNAKLDNFYVDPALRLKATGQYPQAAEVFESHVGRQWQRFSRHMEVWRPGIDMLKNFIVHACRELQNNT